MDREATWGLKSTEGACRDRRWSWLGKGAAGGSRRRDGGGEPEKEPAEEATVGASISRDAIDAERSEVRLGSEGTTSGCCGTSMGTAASWLSGSWTSESLESCDSLYGAVGSGTVAIRVIFNREWKGKLRFFWKAMEKHVKKGRQVRQIQPVCDRFEQDFNRSTGEALEGS